ALGCLGVVWPLRRLCASLFSRPRPPRALPPFPTRRSSDLELDRARDQIPVGPAGQHDEGGAGRGRVSPDGAQQAQTVQVGHVERSEEHTLNSSHVKISYAVFCLKKKKTIADHD